MLIVRKYWYKVAAANAALNSFNKVLLQIISEPVWQKI